MIFRFLIFLSFSLFIACSDKDPASDNQGEVIPEPEIPPEIPSEVDPELPPVIVIGDKNYPVDSIYLEKIHDGLWYMYVRMENEEHPLIIHALRFFGKSTDMKVETWLGKDSLKGRETPSALVLRKSNAGENFIGVINGDFFDMTGETAGIPLGGEMMKGVLTKSPIIERPVIAFDKQNKPYMGIANLKSGVTDKNQQSFTINGVNVARATNYLVLYNSYFGKNTRTNEWGEELLLSPVAGNWEGLSDHKNVKCTVEKAVHVGESGSMLIPKGKIVLSGHGTAGNYLRNISVGDELTISVEVSFQSDNVVPDIKNMIGAYNTVLENNTVLDPSSSESLLTARHPRTSAGFSSDSTYIFYSVVEGRRPALSIGVTTKELGYVMKYLGAANAVNLDGGGSSCLIVDKKVKNYLTDGSERAVANGLSIVRTGQ